MPKCIVVAINENVPLLKSVCKHCAILIINLRSTVYGTLSLREVKFCGNVFPLRFNL